MAYVGHDTRVKHLNGTRGCPHYAGLEAHLDAATKCAAHVSVCRAHAGGGGASDRATRGCHVIMANQSAAKPSRGGGLRYIIYCCASCNGAKHLESFDVRSNAVMHNMDGRKCRASACGMTHPACECGHE